MLTYLRPATMARLLVQYEQALRATGEADKLQALEDSGIPRWFGMDEPQWGEGWTGRLYARRPPVQTLPHDLRPAIGVPGKLTVSLDFQAAHLTILGRLSGDPALNRDLPDVYAALGRPKGEVLAVLNGSQQHPDTLTALNTAYPQAMGWLQQEAAQVLARGRYKQRVLPPDKRTTRHARALILQAEEREVFDQLQATLPQGYALLIPMHDAAVLAVPPLQRDDAALLACARAAIGNPRAGLHLTIGSGWGVDDESPVLPDPDWFRDFWEQVADYGSRAARGDQVAEAWFKEHETELACYLNAYPFRNKDLRKVLGRKTKGLAPDTDSGNAKMDALLRVVELADKAGIYTDARNGEVVIPGTPRDKFIRQVYNRRLTNRELPTIHLNELDEVVVSAASERWVNPVAEWLDALPPAQGPDLLSTWLPRVLHVEPTEGSELYRLASLYGRKWLIGIVAMQYDDTAEQQSVLLIQSARGGEGKSRLGRALLPDWVVQPPLAALLRGDKDAYLYALRSAVVVIDDLDQLRATDTARLKELVTERRVELRNPYARAPSTYFRRWGWWATTNPAEHIRDSATSRRFWALSLDGVSSPEYKIDVEWMVKNRNKVWAQALKAYRDGESWWLDTSEEGLRLTGNKSFSIEPAEAYLVNAAAFLLMEADIQVTYAAISKIVPDLAGKSKSIRGMLEFLQWTRTKKRAGTGLTWEPSLNSTPPSAEDMQVLWEQAKTLTSRRLVKRYGKLAKLKESILEVPWEKK